MKLMMYNKMPDKFDYLPEGKKIGAAEL